LSVAIGESMSAKEDGRATLSTSSTEEEELELSPVYSRSDLRSTTRLVESVPLEQGKQTLDSSPVTAAAAVSSVPTVPPPTSAAATTTTTTTSYAAVTSLVLGFLAAALLTPLFVFARLETDVLPDDLPVGYSCLAVPIVALIAMCFACCESSSSSRTSCSQAGAGLILGIVSIVVWCKISITLGCIYIYGGD
jgi:hypothetical protein